MPSNRRSFFRNIAGLIAGTTAAAVAPKSAAAVEKLQEWPEVWRVGQILSRATIEPFIVDVQTDILDITSLVPSDGWLHHMPGLSTVKIERGGWQGTLREVSEGMYRMIVIEQPPRPGFRPGVNITCCSGDGREIARAIAKALSL